MTIQDILTTAKPLMPLNEINGNENAPKFNVPGANDEHSFTKTLESFVQDVNQMQKTSAHQNERFVKGEAVDIHDVMIASEKAKTSFQLLMELRNKTLDIYREAIKIQV